ncbi:MAG: hypothetical protein LBP99_01785, partial [Azoarcus sp.]|nr:hypothetical protein [Azoarcus sp.]
MKLVKVLWALVASIYVVSSVHAAPPNWRSVNARTFDIAGVKLGMGYDEAISATANHFKLSPKEIKDLKEGTLRIDDFLAKSKIPGSFTLRKDGITFEVGFSGRTPSNKAQSVGVTSVRYAVAQTPENYSMLKEAAFAKYGTPS